ncbi:MAG: glycosyltransferase family 2 protein [Candidatus Scalindua sp.]|nr:glycosyltransferase family 2 protein [Candidatus Scalindua sp.]MBT6046014.1 glycosyltransferase family 2 protein [Candidatus Scalindua sp.]MBT6228816.1 glycosyltransferase family 2 protein [Candidatus Scalindua sp.]
MRISVVIPAHNEEDNIRITIEELLSIAKFVTVIDGIQIIVIDDHSSDNTFDVVSSMDDLRVSCMRLSRKSGSHTALRAGLMEANGDATLCVSADGQDSPDCLKDMLLKWDGGCKVVWALRKDRDNESFASRLFAQIFYKTLSWVTRNVMPGIDLSRADFYLLDKSVVKAINACTERNTSVFGLIIWLGFEQGFVEYKRRKRMSGLSKWSFRSRLRLAKDWIIAFSGLPLKLMTIVGFLVAFVGFSYALFTIINAVFIGKPVQGWSSIMVVILILGGLQMIMFGIVGEYLWRNLDESRKRPIYFIEKSTYEENRK